jgi:type II secretory pathway component PulF
MLGIILPTSILYAGMFFVVIPTLDQTYSNLYVLLVGLCDFVLFVGWQLERWSWRREQRLLNKVVS